MPAVLNEVVTKRWQLHPQSTELAQQIATHLSIRPKLAQLLLNRNIRSLQQARLFLGAPSKQRNRFEEQQLKRSVEVVLNAVSSRSPILVYGDYDVDGITSTTLLVDFLKQIGAIVHYFIPNRFEHGYGLHSCVEELIVQYQARVLITLDCGVSSYDIIDPVKARTGVEVLIFDHHRLPEKLPNFDAMLNPRTLPESHDLASLCTAGVVYEFIEYYIQAQNLDLKPEPFLDLVALGTVADIAKLNGANRFYVKEGLPILARSHRPGIRALLEQAKVERTYLTTRDCGFVIAPRLNASGRLASAKLGVDLLLSESESTAQNLAFQLEALNQDRRTIDQTVFNSCVKEIESNPDYKTHPILVLSGKDWHSGVIGITASKLVDKYSKPVVIVAFNDKIGRASARSIGNIDLYEVLKTCDGFFETFGGHKEAAGFSIKPENMAAFKEALVRYTQATIKSEDLQAILTLDSDLEPQDMTLDFIEELNYLEPFGQGNPQPVFYCNSLKLISCKAVGTGEHVKATFTDATGRQVIDGIGFGLSHKMSLLNKDTFSVAFRLGINEWKGRRLPQLELVDIK